MRAELTPTQLEKLKSLFDAALPLSPDQRRNLLDTACADDKTVRDELESLLSASDASNDFFESLSDELVPTDIATNRNEPQGDRADDGVDDVLGLVGRVVSHFRVERPIAAGGMGAVYGATDTQLGRPVALKFLLPGTRLERTMRERFLREARAAGAIDHPNICSIYEAGETAEGQLFLAMPLYSGETLKARLAREERLPIDEVVRIAEQIARGLHAAATAGIVHRDLKPANVMILPDSSIKILDFGIARVSDVAQTASRDTLGTVPYMSPEQIVGDEVDARADLWALGVLLYEMLTGKRPFGGKHQVAVAHSIVHSEPIRPSVLRPDIPPALDTLVMRLLSKQAENRPASAEAVIADLELLKNSPAQRNVRQLLPRSISTRRKRLPWVIAAIMIAIAVGITSWQLRSRVAARTVEPRIVALVPAEGATRRDTTDYLTLGMIAEISSSLSRLHAVSVPAESTLGELAESGKSPQVVSNELGAAEVVSLEVRRTGDHVLLIVRVYDGARKELGWRRQYDGSSHDLPDLNRQAAAGIVDALHLDLTQSERARLTQTPQVNETAYDLYVRGRAAQVRAAADGVNSQPLSPSAADRMEQAQSFYARARESDPDFVVARARLALTLLALARPDQSNARPDQARLEAEAALRAQPSLSEAHEALASYWMLRADPVKAVASLQSALRDRPNTSDLYVLLGENMRNLGHWDEATSALERATHFDPRNRRAHIAAALTYSRIRRYEQAIAHWDRVIAMDSGSQFPQIIRGYNYLRLGNVDSLEAAINRVPLAPDVGGMTTYARYIADRMTGRKAQLLASLDSAKSAISSDQLIYMPVVLMRAQTLERMGDAARAHVNYESVRSLLEDSVKAHPRDARMRVALGLAYAGLGRRADAIREARTATKLVPVSENSPAATAFMGGAVEIYARLGETDAALELIELLLAMPAGREISVPLLRVDPVFDKLRGDPRFDALLTRFSKS